MEVPNWLHPHVQENIMMEKDGLDKRRKWVVILGLVPFRDGDQWCVLYGENLQEGIASFGKTPEEAIARFDFAMCDPKGGSDGKA